jgi:hypothetical protein
MQINLHIISFYRFKNQQMLPGSSRIYWYILYLPQHVSASHCHHQGVVVTSEATQAISVLWMYMDYDPSSVVSNICIVDVYGLRSVQCGQQYLYCGCMWITIRPVWSAISVLWMHMDYDPSSVVSNICIVDVCGLRSVQCGHWTDRNPYKSTIQIWLV